MYLNVYKGLTHVSGEIVENTTTEAPPLTTPTGIPITDTSALDDSMATLVTEIGPVSDMTTFAWTTSNETQHGGTQSHYSTPPGTSSNKTTPLMTTSAATTTPKEYTTMIETTTPGDIISTTPIGNHDRYTSVN